MVLPTDKTEQEGSSDAESGETERLARQLEVRGAQSISGTLIDHFGSLSKAKGRKQGVRGPCYNPCTE